MDLIKNCIRFREMLSSFIRRELRQRYVGSVIGWPWPFIQPLVMLGVYYVVFVNLLSIRLEGIWPKMIAEAMNADQSIGDTFYVLMLCCGLLPWLMTAEFLMRATNMIPENANLVKKVAFPAELLGVSLLTAYTINMIVIFAVFCIIAWVFTPFISSMLWLFPIVVFLHCALLLGLGYLLATANVFVRDVNQLAPLAINLWFFLTPIVYVKETILASNPDMKWLWIFDWNPMAYMIDLYRYALIFPEEIRYTIKDGTTDMVPLSTGDVMQKLAIAAVISLTTLVVGYWTFKKNKHKFADEI